MNRVKNGRRWLLIILLIASVLAPLAINWLFRQQAPFELLVPLWNAGDALSYLSSLLGVCASFIAIVWTGQQDRLARAEDRRLAALPCLTLNEVGESGEAGDIAFEKLQKMHLKDIVLKKFNINCPLSVVWLSENLHASYPSKLTVKQLEVVKEGLDIPIITNSGHELSGYRVSYCKLMKVENCGIGPAINSRVFLRGKKISSDNVEDKQLNTAPLTLPVNGLAYLLLVIEDRMALRDKSSSLVIRYEDVYGDTYEEVFSFGMKKVVLPGHEGPQLSFYFSQEIKTELLKGSSFN